ASAVYVGSKEKATREAGFASQAVRLPADTDFGRLGAELDRLNADDAVDGVIVQLPLPRGLDPDRALDRLGPEKEVDGLHPLHAGRLWSGGEAMVPATPAGVVELLRRSGIRREGRHAVIVGRSRLVGKPLAALLLAEQCTVTVCHSRTRDLAAVCRQADILVAAVGRPALIGSDHVRPGATVIDVGTNRITDPGMVERLFPGDERKLRSFERRGSLLVGDVDFTAVSRVAGAITPVPGGVGPLTVAMLLVNTLANRRRRGRAG
ncbi:MAG: bifunctional 5,10-methylenetetrahydrofolate dehydrogenase/5,10-methenyltetrahydrofolate cyclohydrolase, partial [Thermoanaerobaculia bacterium]|nr:bifunctional 5,10-methylenetetrahydrofolate dehydrogenase/5,10-methenyltetrahydrofolate cyclohydrolase [Thermoanaerobaculia bacterium]